MGAPSVDLTLVKKLLDLVDSHGLEELEVEENDLVIRVRGSLAGEVFGAAPVTHDLPKTVQPTTIEAAPNAQSEPSDTTAPKSEAEEGDIVAITSPLVGVFYRAPAPDAPPFIEVGDHIEVGTEIGLIEAMKVFSPIPSDVAGEVVEITAEDGKLVQQGDILIRVRTRRQVERDKAGA